MPNLGPFVVSGLSTGAVYVLAGVGLVVLYRASGVLNLAQGALGALCALLAWQIADSGGPEWLGWIAGIVVATVLALFYGRIIAPRLAHSDPIVRAVMTADGVDSRLLESNLRKAARRIGQLGANCEAGG